MHGIAQYTVNIGVFFRFRAGVTKINEMRKHFIKEAKNSTNNLVRQGAFVQSCL